MRWQRLARAGVAVAALGVAATLYFSTQSRPPSERPGAKTVADPEVTLQAPLWEQVRFRGDNRQFATKCAFFKELADGRMLLDQCEIALEDGTLITAEAAETRGRLADEELPAEILLKGKVHMKTPEGASVDAVDATYLHATGRMDMPGAVSFVRGRISGAGVGGSYERDTGVFTLRSEAKVQGGAADNQGSFTAAASSLTFNRASRSLLFDGGAVIDTEQSRMTADRAVLYLTENDEQFRVIELRNQAHVAPTGDPGAPNAVPDMRAVDMDLAFHDGTQALERAVLTRSARMVLAEPAGTQSIAAETIVAVTAPDGRTLTELDARDDVKVTTPRRDTSPAREISASTLIARGDAKRGLTSATFSGGVTFVEAAGGAAAERRATSSTLSMLLAGRLDAVDEAKFQRDVVFRHGDVSGDADLITYRAAKSQLVLEPATPARKPPHVTNGDVDVHAVSRIDVDLTSEDIHAVGDVKTVIRRSGSTSSAALFGGSEPILGFGQEFWYTGRTGVVRYAGSSAAGASLRQGERHVTARAIEADQDGGNLQARGAVDSSLEFESSGEPKAPARRYRVTADSLDYVEKTRQATYVGTTAAPVSLTATDGTVASVHMVLTMAEGSRSLASLEARTNVHLLLSGVREGLSDRLSYDAEADKYILRGNVVVRVQEERPIACIRSESAQAEFSGAARMLTVPAGPGFADQVREDGPCRGTLTR